MQYPCHELAIILLVFVEDTCPTEDSILGETLESLFHSTTDRSASMMAIADEIQMKIPALSS